MTRDKLLFLHPTWRAWAAALIAVCLASACGGGVDSGGTGSPAHSYSSGRVAGFGSVIVNGVRFDDSRAAVTDDDGVAHARSELKLGMVVAIDAGAISTDASTGDRSGVASAVQFGSSIKGPVEAVDAAASTLTVLGQTVMVDDDTVFDGIGGGIAGVHVDDLLELHAFLDASSGVYTATRIEAKNSLPEYKLKGVVAQLDTAAKTFFIGAAKIDYAGANPSNLPNLANGAIVSVKLQTAPQGDLWLLSRIGSPSKSIPDDTETELEGFVTDFVSLASFKVDGMAVDASGSGVVFKKGTSGQLADGVRIEVEGTMQDGVLRASKIEFKRNGGQNEQQELELRGPIESVNADAKSFVVRGTTVVYNPGTSFDRGTADDLDAGVEVEVKGVLTNNGTRVLATEIRFEKQ